MTDNIDDDDDEPSRENGGSSGGVVSELKNVASDAALAVLAPVAKKAATAAAKYAVQKGPDLLEDTVKPMLEDAGGVKGLASQLIPSGDGAGGLLSKLTPGGGGGGGKAGDGTGKGRRMPVQQEVHVGAPIDIVYDQWTQFEDYPKFMHRLTRVEQRDDTHVAFHSKMWGINRMWEAEIVEQRPDERIVFKSVNGVQLTGVVTFHDLGERLTLVNVDIDIDPDGPIEKIARGARFIKRATRGDLHRFKAFVEMREDETGAWRGKIDEGEVVSESDEDYEDEYEDEEPEASYDDEDYEDEEEESSDEDEEPEASAEDSDEDEDQDEQEEERKPARASSRSGSSSRRKSSSSRSGSTQSKRRRGSANGGDPKGSSNRRRGSSGRGGSSSKSKKSSTRSRS